MTIQQSLNILPLSSHETTRNETMPNASPIEQACQEARDRLARLGISAKDWAEKNEFNPSTVYAVLNGQKKCLRGEAHRAAVLLGIKDGVITN